MVQSLALDEAAIISTALEGILYGFSVLMFIPTMWTLLAGRNYTQVNFPMVIVSCLLFILSSLASCHMASDIRRNYSGFVRFRDTFPGGPPAWFANDIDPSFIFKNAVYGIQTALGDGVVIYRCYMVWRSVWVIVLPLILWLAFCSTTVGGLYTLTHSSASTGPIFTQRVGHWITAFYATTLLCNLCATGLLAYRLWSIERNVRGRVGRGLAWPVLMIIVDAGVLYSVTLLAALVCFISKSNGQYVVLDMATPIISIAFYMVIIRVGIAQNSHLWSNNMTLTFQRTPLPQGELSNRARPMHVHIEQLTEVDGEQHDCSLGKSDEANNHQMSRV
ncbi:hypothetical protein MVEN_01812700 [Mycena venus]|uniref:Uncharacterized protein n=1 Tax=Mycena venus TaxID=2733690 RepID=A0A8H6XKQ3_9AGAR|nr:hypothetical protein MVEN_01812700 [Mycena venus]